MFLTLEIVSEMRETILLVRRMIFEVRETMLLT